MYRGIGPTGICVSVLLGMGEADCDVARNLYRHHIHSFRALVVADEIRPARPTPRALAAPRRLGHSFPNGIQQDLTCERLLQIGDAPGVHRLISRGLVVVRGS